MWGLFCVCLICILLQFGTRPQRYTMRYPPLHQIRLPPFTAICWGNLWAKHGICDDHSYGITDRPKISCWVTLVSRLVEPSIDNESFGIVPSQASTYRVSANEDRAPFDVYSTCAWLRYYGPVPWIFVPLPRILSVPNTKSKNTSRKSSIATLNHWHPYSDLFPMMNHQMLHPRLCATVMSKGRYFSPLLLQASSDERRFTSPPTNPSLGRPGTYSSCTPCYYRASLGVWRRSLACPDPNAATSRPCRGFSITTSRVYSGVARTSVRSTRQHHLQVPQTRIVYITSGQCTRVWMLEAAQECKTLSLATRFARRICDAKNMGSKVLSKTDCFIQCSSVPSFLRPIFCVSSCGRQNLTYSRRRKTCIYIFVWLPWENKACLLFLLNFRHIRMTNRVGWMWLQFRISNLWIIRYIVTALKSTIFFT